MKLLTFPFSYIEATKLNKHIDLDAWHEIYCGLPGPTGGAIEKLTDKVEEAIHGHDQ